MKVTSYAVARPAYYDRGATSVYGLYFATVGPHASATRFTYTCPANRKTFIEAANIHVIRMTAATLVQAYGVYVGTSTTRAMETYSIINTVNAYERQVPGTQLTIYAGGTYYGVTYDGSTGGTVEYLQQFNGTEFDA